MGVGGGGNSQALLLSCWGPTLASGFLGHVTLGRQVAASGIGGEWTLGVSEQPPNAHTLRSRVQALCV